MTENANTIWADTHAVPTFQSHKQVRAARIEAIAPVDAHSNEGFLLSLHNIAEPFQVSFDWQSKHAAGGGGYVVFYADGYVSYSPADAFEGGYTAVKAKK